MPGPDSIYVGGDFRFGIPATYVGERQDKPQDEPNAIFTGGTSGTVGNTLIDPKLYEPIPIPDLPAQPTPSFIDDARVSQLTQQYASPAIRSARNALREALTGRYSNPIQQKFKARGALEGFGEAVEKGVASGRPSAINVAMREADEAGAYDKKAYDLAWQRSLLDYNQKLNLQNIKIRDALAQKAMDASMTGMPSGRGGGGSSGSRPSYHLGGGDSGGTPFGTTEWQRAIAAQENLNRENYARDNSGPWVYVEGMGWRRSGGIHPQTIERWTNEGRILGEYPQTRASRGTGYNGVGNNNTQTGSYPTIDPMAGLQYPFHVPFSPSRYERESEGRELANKVRVDAFNKKYGFNQSGSETVTAIPFDKWIAANE